MKIITFLLVLFFMFSCICGEEKRVVFGVSRPPFIMEDQKTGISYELFKFIANEMGIDFQPIFASNARMQLLKKNDSFDIIVEVQKSDSTLFYSAPFIVYRNFVVIKSDENFQFNDYSDLAGKSVCAWQNAKKNLGEAFSSQIPKFEKYKEFPIQENQVHNWLVGNFEVIIIDDTLLKWWIKRLVPKIEKLGHKVDLNNIQYQRLPGNSDLWWYVVFKDKSLRDRFDIILEKMKKNGEYDRIREGFIKEY